MQEVIFYVFMWFPFFWINWKLVDWVVEDRKRIERLEKENRAMRREMERIREME